MDAKELLKAMGFEHQQHTDYYEFGPDDRRISTCHIVTHPEIPGLFLSSSDLAKTMKGAIRCIRILTLMNEGKKTTEEMEELGFFRKKDG